MIDVGQEIIENPEVSSYLIYLLQLRIVIHGSDSASGDSKCDIMSQLGLLTRMHEIERQWVAARRIYPLSFVNDGTDCRMQLSQHKLRRRTISPRKTWLRASQSPL